MDVSPCHTVGFTSQILQVEQRKLNITKAHQTDILSPSFVCGTAKIKHYKSPHKLICCPQYCKWNSENQTGQKLP